MADKQCVADVLERAAEKGQVCAIGAINQTLFGNPNGSTSPGFSSQDPSAILLKEAVYATEKRLRDIYGCPTRLWNFNDTRDRLTGKGTVQKLFRDTAKELRNERTPVRELHDQG